MIKDIGYLLRCSNMFIGSNNSVFWIVFAALSLLLILPIWQLHYLPLSDLPQHAAQIHFILNAKDYPDFHVNWLTPYILAYIPALFLDYSYLLLLQLKLFCR